MELDWEAVSYPIFESCQDNSEGLNWVSMGQVFKMKPGGGGEGEDQKEQTAGIKQQLKARGLGGPACEQS